MMIPFIKIEVGGIAGQSPPIPPFFSLGAWENAISLFRKAGRIDNESSKLKD
jgi:hypothetical protein